VEERIFQRSEGIERAKVDEQKKGEEQGLRNDAPNFETF